MPSRSFSSWALLLLLVAFCLLNLVETLSRSTIPLGLDGVVTRTELRREKRTGVDDVYLLWIDGRMREVDRSLFARLQVGDQVSKGAWERTLRTPRGVVPLAPSRDFWGMVFAMPLLGVAGIWLALRRGRAA